MRAMIAALACLVAVPPVVSAQKIVRYDPAEKDLKYVYATAPPVATLEPGDTLETRTVDAFGGVIQKPGDSLSKVKGDNPLTGPFAIAGAQPGDTLAIRILDLTVDSARGVGALAPGFGALNTTSYTPMLNANLPERIWFYDIDRAANGVAVFVGFVKFARFVTLNTSMCACSVRLCGSRNRYPARRFNRK